MKGLVLEGVEAIVLRDVPEPEIRAPTDAVVAVELAGLCGSDLHPYLGRERVRMGLVAGHEAVGTVVEAGPDVAWATPGERVIVPFSTSCGWCRRCREGLSARCERGELFGYGDPDDPTAPGLGGAQAELLRVPLADGSLVPIPPGIDTETALLLTDTFPAAWAGVQRAGVVAGYPLAVVGLGTVGLLAVSLARQLGADPVLAIDPVDDRRGRAERLGAVAASPDDAAAVAGRVADGGFAAVVEAAGSVAGQRLAFQLTWPGGTLSVIAFSTHGRFGFDPIDAYDRNLTLRTGRAPVRSLLPDLVERIIAGELTVPVSDVVTHRELALEDGAEAYRRFAQREEGWVKATFRPRGAWRPGPA